MAWTYSGDPGGEPLDQVRFLIQDTNRDRQLLTDEEILWLVGVQDPLYGDPTVAAIWAAETIAAKYTGQAQSISADGVSVSVGDLSAAYMGLANQLRGRRNDLVGVAPIPDSGSACGEAYFGIGQFDNTWAGRQDYAHPGRRRHGYDEGYYENELTEWA